MRYVFKDGRWASVPVTETNDGSGSGYGYGYGDGGGCGYGYGVLACSPGDHIVPSDLAEAVGWSTEAVLRAQPWVADLVDDVGGAWVRR